MKPHLLSSVFRYRVQRRGTEAIGQFSNMKLAEVTAHRYRDAIVLDVSVQPHRIIYQDGKRLEPSA